VLRIGKRVIDQTPEQYRDTLRTYAGQVLGEAHTMQFLGSQVQDLIDEISQALNIVDLALEEGGARMESLLEMATGVIFQAGEQLRQR